MTKLHAPNVLGIHCTAHRLSLASKSIDVLQGMSSLEDVTQGLYELFPRSTERTRVLFGAQELVEGEGSGSNGGFIPLRTPATRWLVVCPAALRLYLKFGVYVGCVDDLSVMPGTGRAKAVAIKAQLLDLRVLVTLSLHLPLLKVLTNVIKQLQKADEYLLDHLKVSNAVVLHMNHTL